MKQKNQAIAATAQVLALLFTSLFIYSALETVLSYGYIHGRLLGVDVYSSGTFTSGGYLSITQVNPVWLVLAIVCVALCYRQAKRLSAINIVAVTAITTSILFAVISLVAFSRPY